MFFFSLQFTVYSLQLITLQAIQMDPIDYSL